MTKPEINYINSADVDINETTDVMKQYLNIKKEKMKEVLFSIVLETSTKHFSKMLNFFQEN